MPAFNEEKNLATAVASATRILKKTVEDREIIIIDDGSKDATGHVAEILAKKDSHIRLIHNKKNMGLGSGLRQGIKAARKTYVTLYPSDNEMDAQSFRDLVTARHKADLVSSYTANPEDRPWVRRLISSSFVFLINILFGLRLRYYTGPFIAKTKLLQKIKLASDGVTLLAELKIRLLARGASFSEIPFFFRQRRYGKATLFRWKTVHQTLFTLSVLFHDKLLGRL